MSVAVLAYAITLGLIAAVNPCGFPLLPAYLVSFTMADAPGSRRAAVRRAAVVRALTAGACVTAGFVVTFGVVGAAVSAGAALVIAWVPWIMVVVGAAMVALGILVLIGRWRGLALPATPFRRGRGALAMAGFGVAYGVGSLSCSLPLFLAGVGSVFTSAGWGPGVAAFLGYAIGMGVFVTAAGVAVALVDADAVRRLRPLSRLVPRLGGALVIAVGAYLVYYWVAELADPLATPALVRAVEAVQGALSRMLAADPGVSVAVAAVVIAAAAGAAWATTRRRRNGRPSAGIVAGMGEEE